MEQLNGWNMQPDPETLAYHRRQAIPYRSTVHFADFIRDKIEDRNLIFDLGCGAGHPTAYLADEFRNAYFVGGEISPRLVAEANMHRTSTNLAFRPMNLLSLPPVPNVSGVTCIQVLSWMPDYKPPLEQIFFKIAPRWVAVSSLFYPGEISCRIEVDEAIRPRKSHYNIYSIPQVANFVEKYGYYLSKETEFDIDINLPKPDDPNIMQTYTVQTLELEKKLQFSGPLHLPWHFLMFERR